MSSIAITPTPPPASAKLEAGASPAPTDDRFGDALRQTQAPPKPRSDGAPPHDSADPPQADHAKASAKEKSEDDTRSDPKAIAGLAPATVMVAPPPRQGAAGGGKPLPAAAPTGATPARPAAALAPARPVEIDPFAEAATKPVKTRSEAKLPATAAQVQMPDIGSQTADSQGAAGAIADSQVTARQVADSQLGGEVADNQVPDSQDATKRGNPAGPSFATPGSFSAQSGPLVGGQAPPAPAPPPPPAAVLLNMQASPGQPQFAQETVQHVSWLVGQDIQQARIQLNPPELGPIDVQITTHHDRVDVSFAVQHPQTVHALQQTLPQLQNMLGQHGLNLGQASVGQQAPRRQQAAPMPFAGAGRDGASAESGPPSNWRTLRVATPGRVDDFA